MPGSDYNDSYEYCPMCNCPLTPWHICPAAKTHHDDIPIPAAIQKDLDRLKQIRIADDYQKYMAQINAEPVMAKLACKGLI